jgi:hypothetical protein
MSEQRSNQNLGPMPTPEADEPELVPGGADAVEPDPDAQEHGRPVGRDLDPESNAAVGDALPDEVSEPDDKQQEPDEDSDEVDQEAGTEPEPPA